MTKTETISQEIDRTGVLSIKHPVLMDGNTYVKTVDEQRRSWVVYYKPLYSTKLPGRSWKIVKARGEDKAIKVFRESSLYCETAEIYEVALFTKMVDIPEHATVLAERLAATIKEKHNIMMRKHEQDIALIALAEIENIAEATRIAKANSWPGKFIPENPVQYMISIMCAAL